MLKNRQILYVALFFPSFHLTHFLSLSDRPLFLRPPVKVKFVGQHPPVIPPGLRRIQAATQLLSDGDGDAEGIGSHQSGDVAGGVQQGRVNTLGILQREKERETKRLKGRL